MTHPLKNPENWNKPFSMVVPVKITIMVDDPDNVEYKDLFVDKVCKPAVNELRSILKSMDKSGKQMMIKFFDPIDLATFEAMRGNVTPPSIPSVPKKDENEKLAALIQAAVDKALEAKGLK